MRILGLIPARGGSKRLPRKNLLVLGGKPLLAWTVQAAKASRYLDRVVLTSEDLEIMQVALRYGCDVPFRRPVHLAADDTPSIEPVLHALDQLDNFDIVVLLQPTSPLRSTDDIDCAIEKCISERVPSCATVVKADKSPDLMYCFNESQRLYPVMDTNFTRSRQQDTDPVYVLNGAVYVAEINALRQSRVFVTEDTVGYVMPRERSADIDTEQDFLWCNFLLERPVLAAPAR